MAAVGVLLYRRRAWLLKPPAKRARIYHLSRQYDKAIPYYERAIARDPKNPKLLLDLARCYLVRGRLAEAGTCAEKAAELAPSAEPFLLLGEIDWTVAGGEALLSKRVADKPVQLTDNQHSKLSTVVDDGRKALAIDPKSVAAHLIFARAAMLLGRTDEALRYSERAVELAPESKPARVLLARLLKIAGKYREALEQCRYATDELKMTSPALLRLRAWFCKRLAADLAEREGEQAADVRKLYDEAIMLLSRVIEQGGENLAVRVHLASCCFFRGDYERALAEASRVTQHYERSDLVNVDAHRVRGYALVKLGRYEEAIVDLRRVASKSRDDAEVHHWLGVALLRAGQSKLALDAFLRAAELEPRAMGTHAEIAKMRVEEGDLNAAVRQYRKGIAAQPADPEARQMLVRFSLEHALDGVAERELREVFRLRPKSVPAARELAVFHLRRGDTERALQLASYALRLGPKNAESVHLVARVLAAQERYAEAAARFNEAARHGSLKLAAYLNWAAMHEKAGQHAAAEDVYWRAGRALPGSAELRCAHARFCLSTGRTQEGLDELKGELGRNKGNLAARVILVEHFLKQREMDAALKQAKKGREAMPGNIAALSLLARVHRRRGEWAEFVAVLEDVATRAPGALVAYQRVAAAIHQRHFDRAVTLTEKALTRFPEQRRRIQLDRAVALFFAKRAQEGASVARGLVARDEMDADAGYVISLIELADRGKAPLVPACREDALAPVALAGWQDLVELHKHKPADARQAARILLEAFVYDNAGWHRAAAETSERVFAFAPQALLPRTLVPILWERAGERAKAVALCKQYVEGEKVSPYSRLLLADLLVLEGKAEEAMAHYTQAARGLLRLLDPRMKLALLAYATGDRAAARAQWQEAFQDSRENPVAANNLAWGLATQPGGKLTEAEISQGRSATGAALAAAPKDAAVLDTVGWFHYRLGEDKEAAANFTEAIKNAGYRAIAQFHLGMVHARQGKHLQARLAFERALRLEPNGTFADRARQMLAKLGF